MSFASQLGWHDGSLRSGGIYDRGKEPSAADLRSFIEAELRTSDEVQNRQNASNDFILGHPEFIDSGAFGTTNAKLMTHELQVRGHWPNPTALDFEEAYVSLSEAGLLRLDEKKIDAQRAQELDQRAAEIKAAQFDEADAYTMSMEELERRGRGW
jgi:hypothetical protein